MRDGGWPTHPNNAADGYPVKTQALLRVPIYRRLDWRNAEREKRFMLSTAVCVSNFTPENVPPRE